MCDNSQRALTVINAVMEENGEDIIEIELKSFILFGWELNIFPSVKRSITVIAKINFCQSTVTRLSVQYLGKPGMTKITSMTQEVQCVKEEIS